MPPYTSPTSSKYFRGWLRRTTVAGLVIVVSVAQADSPVTTSQQLAIKIRPGYQRCVDASAADAAALRSCASDEFDYQDKRLNTAYKSLMAAASDESDRASLKAEERTWIRRKESICIPTAPDCAMTQTAIRATELERRLADPVSYGAKPLSAGPDVLGPHARNGIRSSYQACVDRSFGNNPKVVACADDELQFQEERVARAYERAFAAAPVASQRKMADEQERWAEGLKTQCAIGADSSQSEEVEAAGCMLRSTAKRANEVEKHLAK
ncbi:lysozyme inhibitor LprI family protein [Luteibacter yeojuensis]|uniref:lysozyme inhibitor LprI family protein n=1 Tax=Luteibacter yeojuensis TaxID=345309 RepID=UPI0006983132|nr:lysozyme inhibitor LprI family protein [Luteibacter yeojuensis]